MGDDLIEIVAAMVERGGQILAEEPIEDAGAAHQGQREAHQPTRALENQHCKQRTDREVEAGGIAVARDQVGVEDPLIQAAHEADAADQPASRAAGVVLGGEVADQAERHQDQEADMNAADHLTRKVIERRDIELEHRERDADAIGQMAPAAGAEALRETVLEIIEFNLDRRFRAFCLQHRRRSPRPYPATLTISPEPFPSWPGLSRPSTSAIHRYPKTWMPGTFARRRASRFRPGMTTYRNTLLDQALFLVVANRAGVPRYVTPRRCGLKLDLLAGGVRVRQLRQRLEH